LTYKDCGGDGRGHEAHAVVVRAVLEALLRELRRGSRPATSVDAARALCAASARGYERAVDVLLEGDGTPLSGLAAPCATAARGEAAALMATVQAEANMPSVRRGAGPVTRLEAAYRALLETRSAGVAARLLDWAPEVEPEHALVVCSFFGRVHSLVHHVCETRRAGVLREILARGTRRSTATTGRRCTSRRSAAAPAASACCSSMHAAPTRRAATSTAARRCAWRPSAAAATRSACCSSMHAAPT
jgi:hypothetical protein